jgi:putative ABC transport system permease protein
LVLAFQLVDLFGPAGTLSGSARSAAVTGAVIATLASLGALGVVSGFSYLTSSEGRGPRAPWLARVPIELPIAAVGLVGMSRIASRTVGSAPAELTPSAGSATLIFTTLLFVGAGLAAARGFRALFVSVRNRSDRLPPGPYLAAHRLGRARALTLLLMAASVVCLGVFAESQTMVASLRTTVDAKAKVYVGSDVQGRVDYRTPLPGSFPMPLTRVTRLLDAGELSDGRTFDLLAVDPETFAAAAFWKDSFASRSLEEVIRGLESPARGSLPVVAVRAGAFARREAIRISGRTLPVDVVARTRAFPGMTSLRPLLVMAEGPLLRAFPATNPLDTTRGSTEFWVRGDQSRASNLLEKLRYPPFLVLTADEVKDIPTFIAVIDTFLVLGVLGAAAALLVFAGTLMYLQARQRSQIVSYGLATRMGMTPKTHRRALVLEFGALIGSSYAVGVGLAVLAALFVVPTLDPLATIPPNPLLSLPVISLALAFAAGAAATFAGGWFTNRTIQRFDLGEVMRVAE